MIWRWVRAGALVGAAAGALFGLAVVGFADCEGPHCTRERVLGVLAHIGLGLPPGALLGLGAALLRRGLGR